MITRQSKMKLYLAGSIRVWTERFIGKYSKCFNSSVILFEPGTLGTVEEHSLMPNEIAVRDLTELASADAVLAYIRPYECPEGEGSAGTDSCWECGFAMGTGKPVIALVDDTFQLEYLNRMWMVCLSITAVLTPSTAVAANLPVSEHLKHADLIIFRDPGDLENIIIKYLSERKRRITWAFRKRLAFAAS